MAPAILNRRPRFLYLDAYDSFSNNIVAQVEQCIDAHVVKCYIDRDPDFHGLHDLDSQLETNYDCVTKFTEYLKNFDAVIAGPGPGSAKCNQDVGWMRLLWKLQNEDLLPVFGICLGFQSMCLAFGADIERLQEPRHGLTSEILHNGRSIFDNVGQLSATQYHSLQVKIDHRIQTKKAVRYPAELWQPTETCPELEPLAWDFDSNCNGAVLMAARHISKPFWGVQFHPESICTNDQGLRVIQNWWNVAQHWRSESIENHTIQNPLSSAQQHSIKEEGTDGSSEQSESDIMSNTRLPASHAVCDEWTLSEGMGNISKATEPWTVEKLADRIAHGDGESLPDLPPSVVHCATTGSGRLTVSDVAELLCIPSNEAIVLESGLQPDLLPMAVGTGRYSIIGLVVPGETLRLHYYIDGQKMQLRNGDDGIYKEWQTPDPWRWIRGVMAQLQGMIGGKPKTPTWAPFWGGLMGYVSYEAGLKTIDVQSEGTGTCPDVCFAYVTRSVVMDHQLKKIYVQSIRGPDDKAWVNGILEKVYDEVGRKSMESSPSHTPMPKPNPFEQDPTLSEYLGSCSQIVADRGEYCASVLSCQNSIADGQSYELCLTTTNQVRARKPRVCRLSRTENNSLSWKLYKRLTKQNPAPFSAYIRLHNAHILSSSPERYISWNRQQTAQCRPIKGTVAKNPDITASDALAILSSPKERAENLMIVDLVRHQLHGVYGTGNVHVRQLMEVEEYETLWQLVSVIEAVPRSVGKVSTPEQWEEPGDYMSVSNADRPNSEDESYLGFDAFIQSLPAGSMTGAPKKRSCELLQREERGRRRGIYSGVLGYLDIGGAGDFSVVIRTAVKIDEPTASSSSSTKDVWTIGAGGAITAQSTPESEYEEMLGKFQCTAKTFTPDDPSAPPFLDVDKIEALGSISAAIHGDTPPRDGEVDEEAEEAHIQMLGRLGDFQGQLLAIERQVIRRMRQRAR